MLTKADSVVARGLNTTVEVVARLRRRLESFIRRNPSLGPHDLLTRVRAELARIEPKLARAIEGGVLSSWAGSALALSRELVPAESPSGMFAHVVLPPLIPPSPPFGSTWLVSQPDHPDVRWPAVEAAARQLIGQRIVTPEEYQELEADARAQSFAIARMVTGPAVVAVRDAIAEAVMYGGGLRRFRANVGQVMNAAGLTDSQVETIYRTHTEMARGAGVMQVLGHPLIADEFPYVAWDATHDARVRPDHLAMESAGLSGTNIYRADDPLIRWAWPPAAWNCRCHVTPLTVEDAAAAGVAEAMEWVRTGTPPDRPAWVSSVPIRVPRNWPARDGRIRAVA